MPDWKEIEVNKSSQRAGHEKRNEQDFTTWHNMVENLKGPIWKGREVKDMESGKFRFPFPLFPCFQKCQPLEIGNREIFDFGSCTPNPPPKFFHRQLLGF